MSKYVLIGSFHSNFFFILHKYQVQFDTCLIESDQIVKAVTELIPVLHIKRLIVGTSKSNLR